jgi:arylsulfatase A-like enzyme
VCSPTRAGLLTGRYQQRCGITQVIAAAGPRDQGLGPEEVTFASRLKAAGYATGIFGKWHLGYLPKFNPVTHGFDRFRGYVSGNVDYFSHIDQAGFADWWDGANQIEEKGYTTHLITRHAIRFIEENRERPFCCYVPYEAVHSPFQGPGDRPIRVAGSKPPTRESGDVTRAYAEMLEAMDEGIGQILAAVERLGIARETFLFFTSDNGATPRGSNGPLRGFKGSVWEGGHREPAIAYWPGRIAPGVSHELAFSLDLYPTVLAIGGAQPPAGRDLDGVNLLPLLTGGPGPGERTLFWGYQKQRAVRQGPWKLVLNAPGQGEGPSLFHLGRDLGEREDLARAEPRRVAGMRAALEAWEKEVAG